jgi:cytochrome c oxidase subunit 2
VFWPSARTRRFAVAVVLAILGALLVGAPAFAAQGGSGLQPWVPNADSPNGHRIFQLYELISIPALFIFLLVEGLLLAIVIKFRRSKQPPDYVPPQWHGNNLLEITWTAIPLLIILGIAAVSFVELKNDFDPTTFASKAAAGDQMNVSIHGYRYGWKVNYLEDQVSVNMIGQPPAEAMVLPVGKLVRIQLDGDDVIHSWWVPYLMGKTDAVPGYTNYTWIQPQKIGEYRGECAELCGAGHAQMGILVKVVSQSDYDAWVQQQKQAAKPSASPSPSPSPASSPSASPSAGATPSPSPSR